VTRHFQFLISDIRSGDSGRFTVVQRSLHTSLYHWLIAYLYSYNVSYNTASKLFSVPCIVRVIPVQSEIEQLCSFSIWRLV